MASREDSAAVSGTLASREHSRTDDSTRMNATRSASVHKKPSEKTRVNYVYNIVVESLKGQGSKTPGRQVVRMCSFHILLLLLWFVCGRDA